MRVLIIGANGALGHDLLQAIPDSIPAYHRDFDICDLSAAETFIKKVGPAALVNTAAFHNVPLCEEEPEKAFMVNAIGAKNLAVLSTKLGFHLSHISTDYVFGGLLNEPYKESDLPQPLSVYATSKLAGEHLVAAYSSNHSIIRSCGLYGQVATRAKGGNFIDTMVRLGQSRDVVKVVNDEFATPTCTKDLATGIWNLLKAGGRGIFHVTQSGFASWYDFASIIFKELKLSARLEPIPCSEFPSKVARPRYSVLDNQKFNQLTGIPLQPWEEALKAHLERVREKYRDKDKSL